jgi:hypothetical protein
MMARSTIAPRQRPDTLMQLSRSSILEVRLVPRGRAIHTGTKLPIRNVRYMAAFGGDPDIEPTAPEGRVRPGSDMHNCAYARDRSLPPRGTVPGRILRNFEQQLSQPLVTSVPADARMPVCNDFDDGRRKIGVNDS